MFFTPPFFFESICFQFPFKKQLIIQIYSNFRLLVSESPLSFGNIFKEVISGTFQTGS